MAPEPLEEARMKQVNLKMNLCWLGAQGEHREATFLFAFLSPLKQTLQTHA